MFITSSQYEMFEQLLSHKRHIITLEGGYGAGKDVYAKIFKKMGKDVKIVRFADPLRLDFKKAGYKDIDTLKRYNIIFPPNTIIGGWDVSGMPFRQGMIAVAENNKIKDESFYATKVIDKINLHVLYGSRTIIIPDLRFKVEEQALKKLCKEKNIKWTRLKIGEDLDSLVYIGDI